MRSPLSSCGLDAPLVTQSWALLAAAAVAVLMLAAIVGAATRGERDHRDQIRGLIVGDVILARNSDVLAIDRVLRDDHPVHQGCARRQRREQTAGEEQAS